MLIFEKGHFSPLFLYTVDSHKKAEFYEEIENAVSNSKSPSLIGSIDVETESINSENRHMN